MSAGPESGAPTEPTPPSPFFLAAVNTIKALAEDGTPAYIVVYEDDTAMDDAVQRYSFSTEAVKPELSHILGQPDGLVADGLWNHPVLADDDFTSFTKGYALEVKVLSIDNPEATPSGCIARVTEEYEAVAHQRDIIREYCFMSDGTVHLFFGDYQLGAKKKETVTVITEEPNLATIAASVASIVLSPMSNPES